MTVIAMDVFSLSAGADEAAFLARNEQVQEWSHANCKGLLRRTVARNDRAWLVLSAWTSRADAEAELPDERPTLDEFIDPSTFRHNSFDSL
jgi:hypothetical protein